MARTATKQLVGDPPFPETLALYEERCATPVTGFFRRGGPSEVSPEDVLVHLDPAQQRTLAETAPGQALTVVVREDRMPLTSLYDSGQKYTCLVAGGYGMWTKLHARTEERCIRIEGTAMQEDELR